jgi:hypothetical protein
LLRDGDHRVAADEQEDADDGRGEPVPARRLLARAKHGEQDRARDQEAERRHQERRQRLDRDLHPEVGRTPDQVDRAERGPDG